MTPDSDLLACTLSANASCEHRTRPGLQASYLRANSANPRIDAVVIYIDANVAASQAVANNEEIAQSCCRARH